MRVVVFGASGRTGRLVVAELLRRGHEAVGFGRTHDPRLPEGALWLEGDALDARAVEQALVGATAAIICLGPDGPRGEGRACAEGTAHIVAASRAAGVKRIAAVTGAMIGHPREELGWVLRLVRSRYRAAQAASRDAQERALEAVDLRPPLVTVLRPPRLVEAPRGAFMLSRAGRVPSLATARRSDLARALTSAAIGDGDARQGGAAILAEGHVDAPIVLALACATALAEALGLFGSALIVAPVMRAEASGRLLPLAAAAGAAVLEGTLVGLAQAPIVASVYPRLRTGAWVLGTVAGAIVAWVVGMLPSTVLTHEHAGPGGQAFGPPSPAMAVGLAAALGLVVGPVLAAFQMPELRRAGGSRARWLVGTALGWAVGMPLVLLAASAEPVGWLGALRAMAWLALAGACVGAAQAVVGLRKGKPRG